MGNLWSCLQFTNGGFKQRPMFQKENSSGFILIAAMQEDKQYSSSKKFRKYPRIPRLWFIVLQGQMILVLMMNNMGDILSAENGKIKIGK